MSARISVIIPVYNGAPWLRRCVESVAAQTLTDLELLLIDDGSTDGSSDLCDSLAAGDSRIRVIHQKNAGPSAARNAGLAAASGRFLAFADADDWIEPDMLERLLTALENQGADLALCGYFVDQEGRKPRPVPGPACTVDRAGLCRLMTEDSGNDFMWNKLWRRELWEGISFPVGRCYEDIAVLNSLLPRCRRAVSLGLPLYHYIQHNGSITRSRPDLRLLHGVEARQQRVEVISRLCPAASAAARRQLVRFLLWVEYLICGQGCAPDLAAHEAQLRRLLMQPQERLGFFLSLARWLCLRCRPLFTLLSAAMVRIQRR